MNKSYRLIWNETTNTWAVVSELAKARGKRASGAVILAAAGILLAPIAPAFAAPPNPPAATQLPTSGQVVAGQASIAQSGAVMNINQSSNNAAINWQTFNIGSAATVNFIQPSASSATLNRVLDPNPSQIFGRINANGQVFLSNASGVYFGRGSSVNVGALTATTHSISDADFMAGRYNFTRNGATGAVINDGDLTANSSPDKGRPGGVGGYIALLAPEVRNTGVIVAQMGTVALAAGEAYELQFDGARLASIRVEPATIAALVENGNAVQAPGGLVILSARAADQLQGSIVRNSGAIEAKGLVERGGKIVLEGDHITLASGSRLNASDATGGGEVLVGGGWQGSGGVYQATTVTMEQGASIDVSATKVGAGGTAVLWSDVNNPASQTRAYGTIWAKGGEDGGDGGRIETSGHWLSVTGLKTSTAAPKGRFGEWLLDPFDITIGGAASGDAFVDTNPGDDTYSATTQTSTVLASDIGTALGNGNVTIQTSTADSSITVASSITKSTGADSTLTLKAHGNIIQNSGINITSSSNKLNVVFNADSDATSGGFIWLKATAGVGTNGGSITLSGGTNVATGYAQGATAVNGNGVTLDTATLNSTGGNILIRGKSGLSNFTITCSDSGCGNNDGIRLHGSNTINSGTGTIDIQGVAIGTGADQSSNAIETNASGYTKILSAATNTTAINLFGDASAGSTGNRWGTFLWGGDTFGILIAATGVGGGVTINGKGGSGTTNAGGTHLEPNSFVLAASGPISISGTKGASSTYEDVVINSTVGFIATLPADFSIASPVTASTSNISFNANTINANRVFGNGEFSGSAVQSSGSLTLVPNATGQALAVQTVNPNDGAMWINPTEMFTGASGLFKPGFSKVIFGNSTTGNVTLNNYTLDNATEINTGSNAILGAISIANNTLTVNMTGSGTITNTGAVAVSKLYLNGSTSAATLGNTGNAIGTLAANVASLSLVNASALTVGTVGVVSGITATGAIDIATLTGNLTVSQNIATSSTSASAVVLNAGRSTAALTTTGGNILISGSPTVTVGDGGTAKLYTGSVSGSTGLTTLIGSGTGRFRYASDETTTNYSTALTSGKNAIYREAPAITVQASNYASTYGASVAPTAFSVTSGTLQNGDTLGTVSATVNSTGTATSNVGTYDLTLSALAAYDALGYALTGAANTGGHTIGKAHLTVTADDKTRLYGAANPALTTTVSGFITGENVSNAAGFAGSGSATTAAITTTNVGSAVITVDAGNLAATNYDFTTLTDGTLVIGKAAATVTGNSSNVTYTGLAQSANGFTASGLVNNETASVLTGVSATGSGTNAGSYNVTPTGTDGNYTLTMVNGNLVIGKAHLTVTADNQSRLYGGMNPTLTETISGFVNGENLGTSGVTGTATGNTAATTSTGVGTATIVASATGLSATNYDFTTLVDGVLTINPTAAAIPIPPVVMPPTLPNPTTNPPPLVPPISVPPAPLTTPLGVPSNPGSTSGSGDGGSVTAGNAGSGGVSVSLVREPSVQSSGIITVSVPKEMATAGSGFTFQLPAQVASTAAGKDATGVTTLSGGALPAWLKFNPETKTFVASAVPDGAFPMQVVVTVNGQRTTIVISERAEE